MGSPARAHGLADAELQTLILGRLAGRRNASVVFVNAVIDEIHATLPECALSDKRLAGMISEAAMLLGLVPVFDPRRAAKDHGDYGYGHPAHRPDPDGTYIFDPGQPRCLPVDPAKRWRVTG